MDKIFVVSQKTSNQQKFSPSKYFRLYGNKTSGVQAPHATPKSFEYKIFEVSEKPRNPRNFSPSQMFRLYGKMNCMTINYYSNSNTSQEHIINNVMIIF